MTNLHRWLLAALLACNALAFAGLDPPTRLVSAALIAVLALDLKRLPPMPATHRWALLLTAAIVVLQLVPLPHAVRGLLQPGLAELIRPGWAPLSVAPWATLHAAASAVVLVVIALTAARMAATRTGLPALLTILASVGVLTAILGFVSEYRPNDVVLFREHNIGGSPYGPFVNANHFALAMELTAPAALVLAVASLRQAISRRSLDGRGVLISFAALIAAVVAMAAMVRSGCRGGVLFLVAGALVAIPWWRRAKSSRRRWPWILIILLAAWLVVHLAWTKLPQLREEFAFLFVVEGAENNPRAALVEASVAAFQRSPVVGSGLGSYRYAIGPDSPPFGIRTLQQAHNDWLEWLTTTGLLGAVVLVLGLAGIARLLWPDRIRALRHTYRYPAAGAVMALTSTALHEAIDFGLQIPLNRQLCAVWVGMLWGVAAAVGSREEVRGKGLGVMGARGSDLERGAHVGGDLGSEHAGYDGQRLASASPSAPHP